MSKVITANTLSRGTVVFRALGDRWVDRIEDATVFTDSETADAALAAARLDEARAVVVDVFIVDQKDGKTGRDSMTLRNAIRAHGPTIAYRPAVRQSAD